jgi:hypothetical protein
VILQWYSRSALPFQGATSSPGRSPRVPLLAQASSVPAQLSLPGSGQSGMLSAVSSRSDRTLEHREEALRASRSDSPLDLRRGQALQLPPAPALSLSDFSTAPLSILSPAMDDRMVSTLYSYRCVTEAPSRWTTAARQTVTAGVPSFARRDSDNLGARSTVPQRGARRPDRADYARPAVPSGRGQRHGSPAGGGSYSASQRMRSTRGRGFDGSFGAQADGSASR